MFTPRKECLQIIPHFLKKEFDYSFYYVYNAKLPALT